MDQTYKKKIRLHHKDNLELNSLISLNFKDTHYLKDVMRCKIDDVINIFNETDGEFECKIINYEKKLFIVKPLKAFKRIEDKFDLNLIFAPVKKDKTEYIIQKGTELGVSKFCPVLTERTIVRRLNIDRLNLISKEATEQSERLTIPKISTPVTLKSLINNWNNKANILYADETLKTKVDLNEIKSKFNCTRSILVGPEGGFSKSEINFLKSKNFVIPISFGSRVLRCDTAIVVALSYWHFLNY